MGFSTVSCVNVKMFWLLAVTLIVPLFGCTKSINVDREVTVASLDFNKYRKSGFLITPGEYNGDYDACGVVLVDVRPAARTRKVEEPGPSRGMLVLETGPVLIQDAIDDLHDEAVRLGADAIVNFEILPKFFWAEGWRVEGVTISGLAIKRKGAFR